MSKTCTNESRSTCLRMYGFTNPLIKPVLRWFLFHSSLSNFLQDVLLREVWAMLKAHFFRAYRRFEKLVAECYQNERLSVSAQQAVVFFDRGSSEVSGKVSGGENSRSGGGLTRQGSSLGLNPNLANLHRRR